MKPITSFALLCAFAAVAQGAVTDPVGYITHDIAGDVATGADTYLGPVLTKPVDFASETTVSPSGLTTLTFAGGVPTGLDGSSYLEITSGTQEGWWSQIVSSTATTIVISDEVPSLTGNVTVKVRKLVTVGDFLGDNLPGLGDDSGQPDEVVLLDPVTQVGKTIVYSVPPNTSPADWVDFVSYESASGDYIFPGTAIVIRNYGAPKSFVSTGSVKTGATQVDVFPGDNLIAFPYAVGNTFNASNIALQIVDDTNPVPDEVIALSAEQVGTTYVASNTAPSGPPVNEMVDFVTYNPEGLTVILEGSGLVFRRSAEVDGSTLTFPAQVIAE